MLDVSVIESTSDEVVAVEQAARAVIELWQNGTEPPIRALWAQFGGSVNVLSALVKSDLRCRFNRGERVPVSDYLAQYPELVSAHERVISLVYEEFCLREEVGEAPDPSEFCRQYEPWKDSLASQLKYHRLLTQIPGQSTPPRFPEPGERFLRCTLRSVLGSGGAGRVYLVDDEDVGNRSSALKVSLDRGEEPSILGKLDHRRIVQIYWADRDPETGLRGLCMPFEPGRTLDDVLRRLEPMRGRNASAKALRDAVLADSGHDELGEGWAGFPIEGTLSDAVAWVGLALAEGLSHAHDRNIMHRDIKPANVLLTFRGGPKLLDFNLAYDPHSAGNADAALRGGTVPYMSPEQLMAFINADWWDEVDALADLFSLGLLLREMLTGKRPEAPDAGLPMPRFVQEQIDLRRIRPASLAETVPGVPHALDAIIQRCLAFDPEERYTNADVLAEDLRRFLDRRPLVQAVNPSEREKFLNGLFRRRFALGAACLALVGLAVGAYTWRAAERSRAASIVDAASTILADPLAPTDVTPTKSALSLVPMAKREELALQTLKGSLDTEAALRQLEELFQSAAEQGHRINPKLEADLCIQAFSRLIKVPDRTPAARAEKLRRAEAYVNRALSVAPSYYRSHATKSFWSIAKGDREGALRELDVAIELAMESRTSLEPGTIAKLEVQRTNGRFAGLELGAYVHQQMLNVSESLATRFAHFGALQSIEGRLQHEVQTLESIPVTELGEDLELRFRHSLSLGYLRNLLATLAEDRGDSPAGLVHLNSAIVALESAIAVPVRGLDVEVTRASEHVRNLRIIKERLEARTAGLVLSE